jgi:hypothetical protein
MREALGRIKAGVMVLATEVKLKLWTMAALGTAVIAH